MIAMRASSCCIWLAVLCVVDTASRHQKFAPCGKGRGVLTTSRAAALISKVMNKCGLFVAGNNAWNISTTVKMMKKCCIAVRLCYAGHETNPKNNSASKKAILLCLQRMSTTFYKIIPEQFVMSQEVFDRMHTELRPCFTPDIIPEEADIVLAAARQYLKTMSVVGHPLG